MTKTTLCVLIAMIVGINTYNKNVISTETKLDDYKMENIQNIGKENSEKEQVEEIIGQENSSREKVQEIIEQEKAEDEVMITIELEIGERSFKGKLYDNESTRKLVQQLPITLDMGELNGNEKYFYLSERLPSNAEQVKSIHTGDLMLYGANFLEI